MLREIDFLYYLQIDSLAMLFCEDWLLALRKYCSFIPLLTLFYL